MPAPTNAQGAIDEALASLNPTPSADAPPEPETPPAGDPSADETPAGDPPADADPAGEDTPPEGEEAAAAKTPEQIAAEAAAAEAAKKPPDHVNDPISPQLKQETQERIRSLASEVKTLRPQAEAGKLLLDAMADAQMTPQELDHAIGYSKLVKSSNIEDKRRGFNILMNELKALAPLVGESLPGTDPVAAHQDLVAEVAAGKLTPERAQEIAVNRNRAAAGTKAQQANNARASEEAQYARDVEDGKAALNELTRQLVARDGEAAYKLKHDAIVAVLPVALAKVHPRDWASTVRNMYERWIVPAAAPAAPAAPAVPAVQPLRANRQPAGGGVKTPSTMSEAIAAGIQQASR